MKIQIINIDTNQIETTTYSEFMIGQHKFLPGSSTIKFYMLSDSDEVMFKGEMEVFRDLSKLSMTEIETLIRDRLNDCCELRKPAEREYSDTFYTEDDR